MSVVHLNQENFEAEVLKSKKPVLVDFFAQWCGPCKMAAPIMEELADEYKQELKVAKLDVDEAQQLAGKYGVMSIPTVVIFKNGEEAERIIGFPGKEGYKKAIDKQLEK